MIKPNYFIDLSLFRGSYTLTGSASSKDLEWPKQQENGENGIGVCSTELFFCWFVAGLAGSGELVLVEELVKLLQW